MELEWDQHVRMPMFLDAYISKKKSKKTTVDS